jgi:hypothetical protein
MAAAEEGMVGVSDKVKAAVKFREREAGFSSFTDSPVKNVV